MKLDKRDFESIIKHKASKNDSEMMLRLIEIQHKQLKQLVLVLLEKFRAKLDPKFTESEHTRQNNKVQNFYHILLIFNWV